MKSPIPLSFFLSAILLIPLQSQSADILETVDMRIGVLAAGSTVIGPSLPFGSIHPSPDTPDGEHDGYNASQPIRGFSQHHVSGTGWGQYGNLLISPQVGLATVYTDHESPKADEKAEPFQYQVRLTKYDILAQFTPTAHAAIYRFTFPKSDEANIVLNVTHHIPGDVAKGMMKALKRPIPGELSITENGRAVSGFSKYPGGFSGPYTIYFYAEFERAPIAFGTFRDAVTQPNETAMKDSGQLEQRGSYAQFKTKAGEVLQMKIATSFKSVDNAKASLLKEIPAWDYNAVRDAAATKWRDTLASIRVTGGTAKEQTIFNTALYHAHIMPRDRTGQFARFSPDAPMWDDHYAVWDTWRTLYPLFALIRPDVVRDTVNSFIERQRVDGSVADTFIAGVNSFREQGGNGIDQIIADAHAKNIAGIDWERAYAVLKYNADNRRTGPDFDEPGSPAPYRELGWIPSGIMSSSMTLEYAQNDFSAAQLATALGKKDDAAKYLARSQKWQNLWNPDVESDGFKGFIMPRNADGSWVEFDTKKYPGSWQPYFYEANSWTYSYFAPHQPEKIIELMGGTEMFIKRLEHALSAKLLKLDNEPSFLIPQLFHYVGRPDLAAKTLHSITTEQYTLQGYPGDDDSGAMSSYYIWSKLGLFPNAGQDIYYLNGPAFEKAVIQRPGNKPLEISRTGNGIYVASVKLDGKSLDRSWLRHAELMASVKLDFVMSETPTAWAQKTPPTPLFP